MATDVAREPFHTRRVWLPNLIAEYEAGLEEGIVSFVYCDCVLPADPALQLVTPIKKA